MYTEEGGNCIFVVSFFAKIRKMVVISQDICKHEPLIY